MRTPRAAAARGEDRLLAEAQNLARLQQGQTPLMGGTSGVQIEKGDFGDSLDPKAGSASVRATPHALAGWSSGQTPGRTPGHGTPSVAGTPLRTPGESGSVDSTGPILHHNTCEQPGLHRDTSATESLQGSLSMGACPAGLCIEAGHMFRDRLPCSRLVVEAPPSTPDEPACWQPLSLQ